MRVLRVLFMSGPAGKIIDADFELLVDGLGLLEPDLLL